MWFGFKLKVKFEYFVGLIFDICNIFGWIIFVFKILI